MPATTPAQLARGVFLRFSGSPATEDCETSHLRPAPGSFDLFQGANAEYRESVIILGYGTTGPRDMLASSPATLNLLKKAVLLQKKGDVAAAIPIYRRILKRDKGNAEVHSLLGLCLAQRNSEEDARNHLQRAVELQPDGERHYRNLIEFLEKKDKPGEALAWTEKALEIKPDEPTLLLKRARQLKKLGQTVDALWAFETAVRADPENLDTLVELGQALMDAEKHDEAIAICDYVLAKEPSHREAIFLRLDIGFSQNGPSFLAEFLEGKISHFDLDTDLNFRIRLANAYWGVGRFTLALEHITFVTKHAPYAANARAIHGKTLYQMGRFGEAIPEFEAALKIDPELHEAALNLGFCYFCSGDLKGGFRLHDRRFLYKKSGVQIRQFSAPRWMGEDLRDKTLMIWNEQGVGDVLRYSSMFNELQKRCAKLIIETQIKTIPILQRNFPKALVRREKHFEKLAIFGENIDYDVHCPIGSLSEHLRPSLDSFPSRSSFLTGDSTLVESFGKRKEFTTDKFKVGLCWSGKITRGLRRLTHFKLEELMPILRVDGVQFFNIQYINSREEIAETTSKFGIFINEFGEIDQFNDLESVAAIICNLDLVIAISSSVAELASALGIPVWRIGSIAEPHLLGSKNKIPWLPSTKYFPFSLEHGATDTIALLAKNLQALVNSRAI
ncbi:tetratricopeptide repeat protein [Stappia sp. F7233]|uniref:Tetratricopeptide repeat protein n=1 Tax=Stappia albiluteola TaxID=2758565 RepID=A0A839AKA0_9HYPH|nr:tetratricopeptide repeat protein [Stappia albiluteola]MBA5779312.1 tetratricopeptide repeat protein [Stappia albiluteola]